MNYFDTYSPFNILNYITGEKEGRDVLSKEWREYFLTKAIYKYLVPDIDFLYRHYCSRLLARFLGSNFKNLTFAVPRLTVFEIERRGKLGYDEEGGDLNRRLSLYAMNEISFLKSSTNFMMLPSLDASLIAGFAENPDERSTAMWIRKEIQDAMGRVKSKTIEFREDTVVYLTTDPINAFAVEVEGLTAYYFGKKVKNLKTIENVGHKQLFEIILDSSAVFGETRLDFTAGGEVFKSYVIEEFSESQALTGSNLNSIKMIEIEAGH
ncbi:MAG: hypothetical protein QXJ17_02655 [Nitrososphaeria archaeon]